MNRIMNHKAVPMDKSKYKKDLVQERLERFKLGMTEKEYEKYKEDEILGYEGKPMKYKCECCGKAPLNENEVHEHLYKFYCKKCFDELFGSCNECDGLFYAHKMIYKNSEYYCKDCYSCNKCELYGECDHQGAYKKNGKWCYEDLGSEKVEESSKVSVTANAEPEKLIGKSNSYYKGYEDCEKELTERISEDLDELIAWANNYPKDSEIYIRIKRKKEKWQGG